MSLSCENARKILKFSQESKNLHKSLQRLVDIHNAQKESFLNEASSNPSYARQNYQLFSENERNMRDMGKLEIDLQLQTVQNLRAELLSENFLM
jgi:hypothetical protein